MPELPELELLRRDLERDVVDKKVKSVEVPGTGFVKIPTKHCTNLSAAVYLVLYDRARKLADAP